MRASGLGLAAALFVLAGGWASTAAADTLIEAVPTAWRLQDYLAGTSVNVYFTGSTCANGALQLNSSDVNVINRFWSLILSAKLTGKTVGVNYNPTGCVVTNFYAKEQ